MPIGNNFNCAISEVIYWKICVQIQVNSNAQFDEFPFLISQIALLASSFGPPTGDEGEARGQKSRGKRYLNILEFTIMSIKYDSCPSRIIICFVLNQLLLCF